MSFRKIADCVESSPPNDNELVELENVFRTAHDGQKQQLLTPAQLPVLRQLLRGYFEPCIARIVIMYSRGGDGRPVSSACVQQVPLSGAASGDPHAGCMSLASLLQSPSVGWYHDWLAQTLSVLVSGAVDSSGGKVTDMLQRHTAVEVHRLVVRTQAQLMLAGGSGTPFGMNHVDGVGGGETGAATGMTVTAAAGVSLTGAPHTGPHRSGVGMVCEVPTGP